MDHLSFYRLEHIFRERHGVEIPRQQMVAVDRAYRRLAEADLRGHVARNEGGELSADR